jgi:CelD/BcsL family acetyltransferase involved in cellulose biosynthesis
MTGPASVTMIRDVAGLAKLAPEWWQLWRRSPTATPFQSPAWLIAWWNAFSPGELSTAVVRIGARLVGLAPFYVENKGGNHRMLPVGVSISDYLDVLVEPDVQEPALAAISKAYEALPWAEWELCELPPGAAALAMPVSDACDSSESATVACPVLRRSESTLEDAVPRNLRRKLRMTRNRVERHQGAAVLSTDDRSIDWWIAQLWRLHSARWTSRGEAGLLDDPRLRPFHSEVVRELAPTGLVRLHALTLGDAVAGVYYGFHHAGRAYAYLGGFDPAFSYYSPGTFLLAHTLREADAEGASEFHFLRGAEAYKYAWGATDLWNTRRVVRRRAQ